MPEEIVVNLVSEEDEDEAVTDVAKERKKRRKQKRKRSPSKEKRKRLDQEQAGELTHDPQAVASVIKRFNESQYFQDLERRFLENPRELVEHAGEPGYFQGLLNGG